MRQALRQKAQPQSVQYDENVGFPDETVVPPDSEAPYLMTMLQLTERVVNIVLSSEHAPVESFEHPPLPGGRDRAGQPPGAAARVPARAAACAAACAT